MINQVPLFLCYAGLTSQNDARQGVVSAHGPESFSVKQGLNEPNAAPGHWNTQGPRRSRVRLLRKDPRAVCGGATALVEARRRDADKDETHMPRDPVVPNLRYRDVFDTLM